MVRDVTAAAEPTDALLLVTVFGPDAGLHSVHVKTSRLRKVHDVEFDALNMFVFAQLLVFVDDFEVEPLRMAAAVDIIL